MRILVEIAGWEQGCCGRAFAVGEQASWHLVRADHHDGPLPRFLEEHHGQTPLEVPHILISGTVHSIREIRRHRRRALPPLAHDLTEFDITEQDVLHVADRGSGGGPTYRVELDVAEGTALPRYVADPAALAAAERRDREAAAVAAAMQDELGDRMRAALQSTSARTTRSSDGSIAALEPHNAEAAPISWRRSADALQFQAGDGRFAVHKGTEFEHLIAAVRDGRIREEVTETYLRTVIEPADAAEIVAEQKINTYIGQGFRALDGRTAARIRRGSFRYRPW